MKIHEIINEDYVFESYILEEGLKQKLLSAGMAGLFAIMALTGAPPAKAADGPDKPGPDTVELVKKTQDGKGGRVEYFSDGSRTESDGGGMRVYDASGTLIKTVSPTVGGVRTATDHATGNVTTTYSAGPMTTSRTVNKAGQQVSATSNASVGSTNFSAKAP